MDNLDIQKLVEISKMYYNERMTQEVISKYFSISRSAVSLALAEAKKCRHCTYTNQRSIPKQ